MNTENPNITKQTQETNTTDMGTNKVEQSQPSTETKQATIEENANNIEINNVVQKDDEEVFQGTRKPDHNNFAVLLILLLIVVVIAIVGLLVYKIVL